MEVDPRFRQMGKSALRRQRRGYAVRGGAAVVLLIGLGAVGWQRYGGAVQDYFKREDLDQSMVQVADQFEIAPIVRRDTFTNIPGDPLIIPSAEDGKTTDITEIAAPPALAQSRTTLPPDGQVSMLALSLVPGNRQLVAALPSTREEFALFQAARGQEEVVNASLTPGMMTGENELPTSNIAYLRDSEARSFLWRELHLATTRATSIADLLSENGFDGGAAARLQDRITSQLGIKAELPEGAILALRYRIRLGTREVIQLSIYNRDGFVGSLGMSAAGQLVPAADPWADQSLLDEAIGAEAAPDGQQRLLEVIYSAALRNNLSPQIIGEALSMMAKVFDLDGFADKQDRLTMIFAPEDSADPGNILFVGVEGPGGQRLCYVVPTADRKGFECYAPGARIQRRADGVTLQAPIAGVLTRRFTPGKGANDAASFVHWTAPVGGSVRAVADGKVTGLKASQKTGSEVEITHASGLVSRYHGLASISSVIVEGVEVKAGTVIGSVGRFAGKDDTGLEFQLLANGNAVDPLTYLTSSGEILASDAIEALIGRIINVESGGNAAAQNPLSTATGLGQFIESTWLRMLRTYRPDLAMNLARTDQLQLRFDPDMSRQMVRHLAQENEAYLRARGHQISSGRLYLAHFLGPAGADLALSADPSRPVIDVMGAGVVNANPFLRGYSIGDLRTWADRKMSGASAQAVTYVPDVPVSPEVKAYVAAIDEMRHRSAN